MSSAPMCVARGSALALLLVLAAVPARADWPSSPTTNLPICTVTNQQQIPCVATDMAGGAVMAWRDLRNDTDTYAMHVLANGTVDPAWPANGVALASGPGAQKRSSMRST